ncbi:hypothetical protein C3R19_07185 [Blautia producta]|nr:hypothetical protein C3R19_07185 [Blautia producta]
MPSVPAVPSVPVVPVVPAGVPAAGVSTTVVSVVVVPGITVVTVVVSPGTVTVSVVTGVYTKVNTFCASLEESVLVSARACGV